LQLNGAGIVKQVIAEEDDDVELFRSRRKARRKHDGELHDSLANTLASFILHVLGVGLASFVIVKLAVPMITGRSAPED